MHVKFKILWQVNINNMYSLWIHASPSRVGKYSTSHCLMMRAALHSVPEEKEKKWQLTRLFTRTVSSAKALNLSEVMPQAIMLRAQSKHCWGSISDLQFSIFRIAQQQKRKTDLLLVFM